MFNFLSKKTKEEENGVVLTYSEDGRNVVLAVSQWIATEANRKKFPWLVIIEWAYEGDEPGMPDQATKEKMLALENTLEDELAGRNECIHAVTRTGNFLKEWEYYIRDTEGFMKSFNRVFSTQEPYPIQIRFYEDPAWEELRRFMDMIKQVDG